MPLSPEQRADINRRNAAKSTGPKTEAGKQASRRNALTHGLRAEVVALPNEDPAAVQARSDAWNDYYQPQSPAAQHLVNRCVSATLLADRVDACHAAALAKQARDAGPAYDLARAEQVNTFVRLLSFEPALASRGLARSASGCRELIGRWERLERALRRAGRWTDQECDEAIWLQGFGTKSSPLAPEAWLTAMHAELCRVTPSPAGAAAMLDPGVCPESLRGRYHADSLPSREESRVTLAALALAKLHELRKLEADLRAAHEEPDRAEASERALTLNDPASARVFLRYHAEARTSFHRAYSELVKTLARDAANRNDADNGDAAADDAVADDRPAPAPPEAPAAPEVAPAPVASEPPPPNEANPPTAAAPAPSGSPSIPLPTAPETAPARVVTPSPAATNAVRAA